ncbi:MAG: hypothetical protein QOI78_8374, partial [Actinomycetota bacterium]|nr:hypothetical protein [Actinomycetota bacterium]
MFRAGLTALNTHDKSGRLRGLTDPEGTPLFHRYMPVSERLGV